MLDLIYKWCKILAVLSIVPLMIVSSMKVWQLGTTSNNLLWNTNYTITTLPVKVDERIGKLQTDVLGKIDTVQNKLNAQVTTLATLADGRIEKLTTTADSRIESIQGTVATIGTNLDGQLTTANSSISSLATTYNAVPAAFASRFNRQTDCDKNALCIQNQFMDSLLAVKIASKETATTMIGVNEALPTIKDNIVTVSGAFAKDLPLITKSFAETSSNVERLTHPHWYDRALGYGVTGLTIYRALNPATNIVNIATQTLATQK